jgi:hypothetical protein
MLKRSVCCGVGLLLAVGANLALAQTRPTTSQLQPPNGQLTYERGHLVSVDPVKGVVVIRRGAGPQGRNLEYRVAKGTLYYGKDNTPLANGLRFNGFRPGVPVWYSPMPAAVGQTGPLSLNGLRLGPAPAVPPGAPGAPGATPPPPGPGR